MKYDKQRLFEVTARLDKTFKPKMNEELEVIGMDAEEVPAEEPAMDIDGAEEPVAEQSPEEKLAELTAKVDEMYAMLHGEAEEEAGEEIDAEIGTDVENLQEWNFDKKKGEEKEEETPAEEKEEEKDEEELDEEIEAPAKPKIPVQAVAKVGGAK